MRRRILFYFIFRHALYLPIAAANRTYCCRLVSCTTLKPLQRPSWRSHARILIRNGSHPNILELTKLCNAIKAWTNRQQSTGWYVETKQMRCDKPHSRDDWYARKVATLKRKRVTLHATEMPQNLHNAETAFPLNYEICAVLKCKKICCCATNTNHDNVILITSLQINTMKSLIVTVILKHCSEIISM